MRKKEQDRKSKEEIIAIWNERLQSTNAIAGGLVELSNVMTEHKVHDIDQQIAALKNQENGEEQNAQRIAELEEKKEGIRREAAKKRQKFEIAQVISSGIMELGRMWASTSALPFPANVIAGGLQAGVIIARSALNVKKIRKQTYADGGFTEALSIGPSGKMIDGTGHAVAGVVHENEWVAPRWMTESPRHANVIGWLESERTRRFNEGGYTTENRSQDSGVRTSPSGDPAAEAQAMQSDFNSKLDRLNRTLEVYTQRVDEWAQNLQVHNDVRDTRDALKTLNRIDRQSSIR